jgi:type IV fimbrial biogenesis protein FimT
MNRSIGNATSAMHLPSSGKRNRAAGFTVVEMLAVVSVVGILAMVAAPSFSQLIASQRASAVATDLFVVLIDSRSEAIKRNVDSTTAPKAGGWPAGWQTSVQDPNNAAATIVVEDHPAITGITISGPDVVVYQSSGRVQGNAAPCFAVTATQGSSVVQRWVAVDLSGRPLVRTSTCG